MSKRGEYDNLMFVDVEARGVSPVRGTMTEFGVVHYPTRNTFHGRLFESWPDPEIPAIPVVGERIATDITVARELTAWLTAHHRGRVTMVSDNPAYDFMWVAGMYDIAEMDNPFGFSGRRLGDYWAGKTNNWHDTQKWKNLRKTPHDHNPVNDAMGNVEAFAAMMEMDR